jgi:hypothetical protein
MLVVFVAALVGLLTRAPADEPAAADEPDDDPDQSEASTEAVLAATPSH